MVLSNTVSRKFFRVCPIITCAKDEAWESQWQKMVCTELQFPADTTLETKRRLWNEFSKPLSREIVNRRRQNTTGDMKTKFKGTPKMHIIMFVPHKNCC